MVVFYTSDGEHAAMLELDELIDNFLASDAGVDVSNLRHNIETRGWHTGSHDFGQFLVLDAARFTLKGKP